MESISALELDGVTKRFGETLAVSGLSLVVPRGAFVGLLGRNGAGKTTTIQMCTGLLRPGAGTIRALGFDVCAQPMEVKRRIGVMPQDEALIDYLTGPQFLQFAGRMHGLDDDVIAARSREIFDTLDLAPPPGALVREYSYGMKKKLALGSALLHGPEMLFLDEPFEGIDPMTGRTIRTLLTGLRSRGVTILMSSHILEIVERLCDTIAVLEHGRLLAFGSPAELRERHGGFATLEDFFVSMMGEVRPGELSWL